MSPANHLTPKIRKLLEQRKIHEAYLLAIKQNPPDKRRKFFGISEQHMEAAIHTSTPVLSFCSEEQLFELRTVLALWFAECEVPPRDDLKWDHPMPVEAAFRTLLSAYQINFTASEWKKSGIVLRASVRNSTVETCKYCAAKAGEYDIKDLPLPPFTCCTNTQMGCRCIIVGTEIDKLKK